MKDKDLYTSSAKVYFAVGELNYISLKKNSPKREFTSIFIIELLLISSIIFILFEGISVTSVLAWDIQKREDKWTLLMPAHAPRYGKTEAVATCFHEDDLYILIGGVHNYISDSLILRPEDGNCCARFRKCKWLYEKWTQTGEERFLIETKYDYYLQYNIYGNNRSTCEDDIRFFSHDGIWSINFTSRYTAQDKTIDNPSDSWWPEVVTVQHNQYWAYELSISVKIKDVVTIGVGKFYWKNISGSIFTYTYSFGPKHKWGVDYLESQQKVWAFKLLKNY